tara:strand:+ start:246 stop:794 length:549 start_codon:yes stop_codon:yes gene_type:complete
MDHLEAIVFLKNIINPDFSKKIISFIDNKATKNLGVDAGDVNTKIRKVKGYSLNFKTPTNIFYWNFVKKEIERSYVHYKAKFPKMSSNKINQIDLLKYRPGGKYELHIDHFSTTARCLSVIINLNDDYKGGDLVFTDQKENEVKRINLQKNSIVFFPSNFLYPHIIEPILKGTRYSIVAWLQ